VSAATIDEVRRTLLLGVAAIAGCGGILSSFGEDPADPSGDGDASLADDATTAEGGAGLDGGAGGGDGAGEGGAPLDANADGPGTASLRVFVSQGERTGASLGSDIDTYCQSLANTAALGGKWVSWLSHDFRNAEAVVRGNGPWRTLDGDLVAQDKNALLSGTLAHGIDRDQTNAFRSVNVWTGSSAAGGAISISHCNNWTANTGYNGRLGVSVATNFQWSDSTTSSCALGAHVYCFEVPE
jgi:hypothetical protein